MAEIPLNMLDFVENCLGEYVSIAVGLESYEGKFVDVEGDKVVIEERGTGERKVIDVNSITSCGPSQ